MRTPRRWLAGIVALQAAALLPAQDTLGLGRMWTFERAPLAYLQREYGFAPDAAWWDRMRLASLRFGSHCSASFVSPAGLVLTNHHCVREQIAKVQGAADWVRDGFLAHELADEVPLPGLTLQQLVAMRDVTAAVDAGTAGVDDAAAAEAIREANRERLLADARASEPALEPQLVRLFQGALWQLYHYRVYTDVRLVMAPHLQVAHFGGDPDNFVYPRYALDFAFCRAWVDGRPADTAATHFAWGDGPAVDELVFVTGNPGGTQRALTMAQIEFQRDVHYPRVREMIDGRLAILRDFAARDAEAEKRLRTTILRLENGQKLYRGEHGALLEPAFLARKQAAEAAFLEAARRSGLGERVEAARREIEQLLPEKRELDGPLHFHGAGGLPLLLRALALVDYAATGDEAHVRRARACDCRPDPVQEALFVDHLRRAGRHLPADDPWLAAVRRGRSPEDALARLLGDSRLCDDGVVDDLVRGGATAIMTSADPALAIARRTRPLLAANAASRARLEAAESAAGARLAALRFAVYGDEVSPDATFTLRWGDGRVRGYDYNGTRAPWRTVMAGLFARAAEFDEQPPFDLPLPWLLARDRIDMRAAVDFVCTVDSTGGNSGSPIVNQRLELIGLLFDGNIESLGNEFLFGDRAERSVCVHPQGIVEALRKVYGATRLLRELAR